MRDFTVRENWAISVLSNNRIVSSWKNVFAYYDAAEEEDFNDVLTKFLNDAKNYEVLSKTKLNENSNREEDYIKKMSEKILHSQRLTIDAFTKYLDSLPYIYNQIKYTEFDAQRLAKLLDKRILTLTPNNFNGLKAKGKSLSTRLIEIHQNKFVENFSELAIDASDWLLILKSPAITQPNRLSLIQTIDDSIIVNNSIIADVVCNILPTDKQIILRYEVLEAMFKSNTSVQKRVALLNLHLSNLDDVQVQSLIENLGEDYAKIFRKQHKPVFLNNNHNLEFFNKLKERDLIIRYELEDKGKSIRVFAKY